MGSKIINIDNAGRIDYIEGGSSSIGGGGIGVPVNWADIQNKPSAFPPTSVIAENVNYNNTTSGLLATNIQTAIDELNGSVDTKISQVNTRNSNPIILASSGDVLISSVDSASSNHVNWIVGIQNSGNMRTETVIAVFDGSAFQFGTQSTASIGDTSDVNLYLVISGQNLELRASNSGSSSWNIRFNRTILT